MKSWEILYLSYEGNVRTCRIDTDDLANEDDAASKAYQEEAGYSGDNIYKIITINEL